MSESENSEQEIHEPVAFGQQLMLAREKAGMTIDEAARALNLNEDVVEAIEDSDLAKLPPVAFVKGYIRTYAKILGLSEETIIKEFEQEVPHKLEAELHPRSALPDEADSQTPVIKLISTLIIVFAVLVLSYAIYSYYIEKSERIEKDSQSGQDESLMQLPADAEPVEQQAEITEDDTQILEALPEADEVEVGEIEVDQAEVGEIEAEPVETGEVEEVRPEPVPEAEGLPQQVVEVEIAEESTDEVVSEAADEKIMPVPTVVPITGGDVLAVSVEQDSWAVIDDANDIRLFYGMIKPGRDLSLTGQAPFDIFLGNAPVVSLSLNATNIDMTKYIRSNNIAQFKVSVEDGRVRFH